MRRPAGFTLLEVLVSLAILSAIFVLAYRVMSGAVAAEERSERWTAAALLGEGLMRDALTGFPDIQETDGKFPDPYADYSWKKSVRPAAHSDAREVHVTVLWGEGDREESIMLPGVAVK